MRAEQAEGRKAEEMQIVRKAEKTQKEGTDKRQARQGIAMQFLQKDADHKDGDACRMQPQDRIAYEQRPGCALYEILGINNKKKITIAVIDL